MLHFSFVFLFYLFVCLFFVVCIMLTMCLKKCGTLSYCHFEACWFSLYSQCEITSVDSEMKNNWKYILRQTKTLEKKQSKTKQNKQTNKQTNKQNLFFALIECVAIAKND